MSNIYIKYIYIYIYRSIEVAIESWPEWDFNPRRLNIYIIYIYIYIYIYIVSKA